MFFKMLKKARELCKEEVKLHKSMKRIRKASLDYEAFQDIVNNVANSPLGIEVDIRTDEGVEIKVRQTMRNEIAYESFYDKYNKQHNK